MTSYERNNVQAHLVRQCLRLPVLVMIAQLVVSCATSPLGRSQLLLLPESQLEEMGRLAYQQALQETPRSGDPAVSSYVGCITDAIVNANRLADQSWEVTVFDTSERNAFALPGGKIGVFAGLLEVADSQDELAAAIGRYFAPEVSGNLLILATSAEAIILLNGSDLPGALHAAMFY